MDMMRLVTVKLAFDEHVLVLDAQEVVLNCRESRQTLLIDGHEFS